MGDVFGNGESSKTRKLGRNIKSLTEDLDLLRSPDKLKKHLGKLEKDMLSAAANLEFEEAGRLRDEISRLKNAALSV